VFANPGDHHLVVDLTDSSFMDSTGLKALVMANRKFDESGRSFAIAVSRGPVSRLIDLSGVQSSIRVVESTDDLT
ncbi:MAG TPA: STAS domain-containing protein, partial [Acidimicrobiia bacterium]|nr:STAS domain-containing protein [Acidimicrobiia bacterium]